MTKGEPDKMESGTRKLDYVSTKGGYHRFAIRGMRKGSVYFLKSAIEDEVAQVGDFQISGTFKCN